MPAKSRLNPEQEARVRIDEMLVKAGWVVVDYGDADFAAGPGVAIREFMTPNGPMDYLLVAERKVVGSIEAKREGETLRQVEVQADRYADGFEALVAKKSLPRYHDRLPFHYISTGTETLYTSRLDPIRRPREVFHFHKPETLAAWAVEDPPYRARLRQLPALKTAGLRDVQAEAIKNLEASLADDRPRALAAITMGGGKTRFAVAEAYRLLTFGKAKRILFLVDRVSLGDQAKTEFLSFVSPDDGRRFGGLYGVQVLRSSEVDKAANVIICTIQRLYSLLRGEKVDYEPDIDEVSGFEAEGSGGRPVEVSYNKDLPVEFFELIWIDECHRSIYGRWGQVLDYFDAARVGLTATPTPTTLAYFDDNVIAEYSQQESVFDGVNVDQQLYRIRTEVGEAGGIIEAGEWVKVRDKLTRAIDLRQVEDEFIYEPEKLDRAVVNPSQIRAVVRAFKARICTEIFPDRDEVPKTIFFAKHDQHAEDILKVIWEEFGKGSEFAKKITYKAEGTVAENINDFRNDAQLRIAVTVEQIGTGTDIKAVEALVFMRMVGSRVLLNQMRGRAVRTMDKDDFWKVTPGAAEKGHTKEYCVLIDAIGITDEDVVLAESSPVSDNPTTPLKSLLRDLATGLTDDENLRSAALRLVRLNNKLSDEEREDFARTAGGARMTEVVTDLRNAIDPVFQVAAARAQTGSDAPSEEDVQAARDALVENAIAQLRRVEVRQKIEQLQLQITEQYIHVSGHDQLISAGFVDNPTEAKSVLDTWKEFIDNHRDEYIVLQVYYSEPFRRRPSLADVKALAAAISLPPLRLTPERLWTAYETLDADRVKGHGGKLDADLVRLIRYALERDDELVPHEEVVHQRFTWWLEEQQQVGRSFSSEQMRWLVMVRDHVAESMSFDPAEDYDLPPFSLEGGATAAYQLFGRDLNPLVDELNEALAAA
jgi:type I restriction enzyme, R subunit